MAKIFDKLKEYKGKYEEAKEKKYERDMEKHRKDLAKLKVQREKQELKSAIKLEKQTEKKKIKELKGTSGAWEGTKKGARVAGETFMGLAQGAARGSKNMERAGVFETGGFGMSSGKKQDSSYDWGSSTDFSFGSETKPTRRYRKKPKRKPKKKGRK